MHFAKYLGPKTRHYVKCMVILGIFAKVNQGFRQIPKDSKHFAKCLVMQFACNIYI